MSVKGWSWPIPLTTYDRHPELRPEERVALQQSVDRMDRSQTPLVSDIAAILACLTRPLEDALEASAYSKHGSRQTVNFLLRQMHQRQTPYWVWSETEWGEISSLKLKAHSTKTSVLCVAYLLGAMRSFYRCGHVYHSVIANRVFGAATVRGVVDRFDQTLSSWGYNNKERRRIENVVTGLMLLNGHPAPDAMSYDLIDSFREMCPQSQKHYVLRVSKVLAEWGIITSALPSIINDPRPQTITVAGIAPEWVMCCQRWLRASTLQPKVKQGYYYVLLQTGRWLQEFYPEVTSPEQWTREMATEFTIHLRSRKIGDYTTSNASLGNLVGKPLRPATQRNIIGVMRRFFQDFVEWGWGAVSFESLRYFRIPNEVAHAIAPNPRIIADDIWAKLLWSGLNLEPADLPRHSVGNGHHYSQAQYPFEMTHALAMVWLFGGLRNNEIRRLRVGCIRWQETIQTDNPAQSERVCLLDVPVNKTSPAFTKPVSYLVGEAIETWEAMRPKQPLQMDRKTRERVAFLFAFRGQRLGTGHVNNYLIPLLCRKANVPQEDVRGRITSHRARSTIASQLANAREPMTLLELMQWLGHSSPKSTQHYVKLTPNKLTQAYREAGYFDRNLRTIEVLLDQEAIRTGAVTHGEAWKYYDLGHGYCSYDFFDQCPHRMACAKCAFYIPKASSAAQILEARTNLQRLLQQIPLTEAEAAAVEDGMEALEKLQVQLLDTPTPSGETPRELMNGFVRIEDVT